MRTSTEAQIPIFPFHRLLSRTQTVAATKLISELARKVPMCIYRILQYYRLKSPQYWQRCQHIVNALYNGYSMSNQLKLWKLVPRHNNTYAIIVSDGWREWGGACRRTTTGIRLVYNIYKIWSIKGTQKCISVRRII